VPPRGRVQPVKVPRAACHLTPNGDWAPGDGHGAAVRMWPYTQHWAYPWRTGNPGRADPVNLFVRGAPAHRVARDLSSEGWTRPDDGQTHSLWLNGRPRRMDDHVAAGTTQDRFHARLWSVEGGTVVSTHEEYLSDAGRHVVVSWDAARGRLFADLVAAGYAELAPSAPVCALNLRGVSGDGRIWCVCVREAEPYHSP
jgi:hypothetical protein